jgi:hypothetical protein
MASSKPECAGYLALRKLSKDEKIPESVYRTACHGDAEWKVEHEHYCLMHAPTKDKAGEFGTVLKAKLSTGDYDFRGVWFPGNEDFSDHTFENEVNFHSAEFSGAVDFSKAKFKGNFANFNLAQFSGGYTDFNSARFDCAAYFNEVQFSGGDTNFNETHFNWAANFLKAQFSVGDTFFKEVQFGLGGANFAEAQFRGGHIYFLDAQFKGVADFHAVEFSGGNTYFAGAVFEGEKADFGSALFGGAVYFQAIFGQHASFIKARFSGDANFGEDDSEYSILSNAKFCGNATFASAVFEEDVLFKKTQFLATSFFNRAIFNKNNSFDNTFFQGDVSFCETVFNAGSETSFLEVIFGSKVSFDKAKINGYVSFFGSDENEIFYEDKNILAMDNIRVNGKDKLLFCNVLLRPRWFVNCDPRNFIFTTIHWGWSRGFGGIGYVHKELGDLMERKIDRRLLRIAYSNLAVNAEENNRFGESSAFRKMSFEADRLERISQRKNWWDKLRKYFSGKSDRTLLELFDESRPGVLQFLYRWLSGYGESWARALFVLFTIWAISAVLYLSPLVSFYRWDTKVSSRDESQTSLQENKVDKEGRKLNPGEALTYSFAVMALQKPEPKPLGLFTGSLVLAETVLAPIQLALLALAIRRKFMR